MKVPTSKFQYLVRNISRHITLTKDEKELLYSLLAFRRLRKKQYLLQEGEICRFESYVVKGCLRLFYIDRDGIEHNVQFAVEDWWISDLESLLKQTPATLNIQALEDCDLITFDRPAYSEILSRIPKFEKLIRILFQNSFVARERYILQLVSRTAEERYINFSEKNPSLMQRIPQKHIAAYLGITPEFLSHIRNRLTAKQKRLK